LRNWSRSKKEYPAKNETPIKTLTKSVPPGIPLIQYYLDQCQSLEAQKRKRRENNSFSK